jgi:hypothetical protein
VENKVGSKDGVAGAGTLKAKPSWIFPYCWQNRTFEDFYTGR